MKLLCFFGWHEWTWKLQEGEPLVLNSPPPDHARCHRCGKVYKPIDNPVTRAGDALKPFVEACGRIDEKARELLDVAYDVAIKKPEEENEIAQVFVTDLKEIELIAKTEGDEGTRHRARMMYLGAMLYRRVVKDGRAPSMYQLQSSLRGDPNFFNL